MRRIVLLSTAIAVLLIFSACEDGSGGKGGQGATPPTITTISLPQATAGQPYSANVSGSGGSDTGYTWSIAGGSLPSGLGINPSGTPATTIAGTPGTSGVFDFTVELVDSDGGLARKALQIEVLTPPALAVNGGPALPDGTVGQTYSESISATGGTASGYSWSITAGSLPPGIVLASMGMPATTLSGTPNAFGRFDFTVEVMDSLGTTGSAPFTIVVVAPGASDTWPTTITLAQDRLATAVFTGSEIIQFGGQVTPSNGGEVMNPGTGVVTSLTTTGAPAPRIQHSAVWTGSEMIVFGGQDGTNFFNDAYTYDPVADTWTALSGNGAPIARANHTAVWTGSEMIVWGGRDVTWNGLDDGAAYDPATDTWRTLASVPGGFEPRELHKAFWTGTEMVLWGGVELWGGNDQYDGAVYDVSTDSWSLITDSGAPRVKAPESSVLWTGSQLLVYGLSGANSMSGALWDPATNTWSSTATGTARRDHTTVPTPAGVYVWGGWDPNGHFNFISGEFFDFTTQTWNTVASLPIHQRFIARGFWTGSQVIIWGGITDLGFGGQVVQADGAVYQP